MPQQNPLQSFFLKETRQDSFLIEKEAAGRNGKSFHLLI